MQFDSLTFAAFFVLVLTGYNLSQSWDVQKNWLLVCSYAFYAAWSPIFLPLLIVGSFLDWWLAKGMAKRKGLVRRRWLAVILTSNLSVLFFFKYALFVSNSGGALLNLMGLSVPKVEFSLILPLGISFYIFHSLSYCIDVYKEKIQPTSSCRDYLLYVAFFPQLVAGPIVRWAQMGEQLQDARKTTLDNLGVGFSLILFGLFQKICLADAVFAPVANKIFGDMPLTGGEAWLGVIAFSGQILCDFAGYSSCALGAALAMGFKLPLNFQSPYAATSFSEFWRRWHISLSTWLRDYVYISLGGNRSGHFKTYRNLMLTMLIGGLWHGAAWTFVIWGGLHGLFLIVERVCKSKFVKGTQKRSTLATACMWLLTWMSVLLAWAWFRSSSVDQGLHFMQLMLNPQHWIPFKVSVEQWLVIGIMPPLIAVQWLFKNSCFSSWTSKANPIFVGLVLASFGILIMLSPGMGSTFIYFHF